MSAKEFLTGIAVMVVLALLCSDQAQAIWSAIWFIFIALAIFAALAVYLVRLFQYLPYIGKVVLIVVTIGVAEYMYNHRDVGAIVLGLVLLGGVIAMASRAGNTYHGQNDDFHN